MILLITIILSFVLNSCHLEIRLLNEDNNERISKESISSVGLLVSSHVVNTEKFLEDCVPEYDMIVCTSTDMLLAIKEVNEQLAQSFAVKSTTFSIQNNKNMPLMVTAGHVCQNFNKVSETVSSIISSINFGPEYRLSISAQKINIVYDINGNEYTAKDVIYTNSDKPDVCVYTINKRFPSSIPMSNAKPQLGDKLINIAIPFGIFDKQAIPIFEGQFSGTKDNNHIYTIPAGPGSSGSPVLLNNKLIGIIHSVDRRIKHVSYGTPLPFIKNVIELE